MKEGIHPKYFDVEARCACGATWKTRSTKQELHLEICSNCHPFFTRLVEADRHPGPRVQRFTKKFGAQTVESRKQKAAKAQEADVGVRVAFRPPRASRAPRSAAPASSPSSGLTRAPAEGNVRPRRHSDGAHHSPGSSSDSREPCSPRRSLATGISASGRASRSRAPRLSRRCSGMTGRPLPSKRPFRSATVAPWGDGLRRAGHRQNHAQRVDAPGPEARQPGRESRRGGPFCRGFARPCSKGLPAAPTKLTESSRAGTRNVCPARRPVSSMPQFFNPEQVSDIAGICISVRPWPGRHSGPAGRAPPRGLRLPSRPVAHRPSDGLCGRCAGVRSPFRRAFFATTSPFNGGSDLVVAGRAPIHAAPNYLRNVKDPIVYDDAPEGRGMRFAARARILRTDGRIDRGPSSLSVQRRAGGSRGRRRGRPACRLRPGAGARAPTRCRRRWPGWTRWVAAPSRRSRTRTSADYRRALRPRRPGSRPTPRDEDPHRPAVARLRAGRGRPRPGSTLLPVRPLPARQRSRPGGPAVNLQGIWNPHLRPPWSSNYTVNINTEMNYWPADTTNLAERHEPLLRFIGDLAKTGAVTARHFYGCRRLVRPPQHRHLGPHQSGWRLRWRQPRLGNWPMAGVWLSRISGSTSPSAGREWLRATGYPLMKGAAEFALDWWSKARTDLVRRRRPRPSTPS